MKKILIVTLALAALAFTGCGNEAPHYQIGSEKYNDTTYDYIEKDGCIFYTDTSHLENKVCGSYSILAVNGIKLKK